MNKYFTEQKTHRAYKYAKGCSTSLTTKEKKIKITMRYDLGQKYE